MHQDAIAPKKKILVVCQYYYPENMQITPICETLVHDGYTVTVLTGLPNYPTGVVPEEYRHDRHRHEVVNGVEVYRVYEVPRGRGALRLGINYMSFVCSSMWKARGLSNDYDMVLVYQLSPVTMALAGILYAKKQHVPLLHYCCDLWPESMKLYIKSESNPLFYLVKALSCYIYRSADLIAAQSSSFITYLMDTHAVPQNRLTYLPAFADESYLATDFTPTDNSMVNFVFLGNLGIAQNLLAVLDAVKKLKDVPGFRVHFVGDGSMLEQMKEYTAANGLEDKVTFYGRLSVEEMPRFYQMAHACLVSLKADNATGLTLPTKVQGYMAAGKAILGMIDGSASEVIKESGCGICVPAGDSDGLAQAMKDVIANPAYYLACGKRGRDYFRENFAKDKIINRLEQMIDDLRRA